MGLIHWLQKSAGMLETHFWPDKEAVPKESIKAKKQSLEMCLRIARKKGRK